VCICSIPDWLWVSLHCQFTKSFVGGAMSSTSFPRSPILTIDSYSLDSSSKACWRRKKFIVSQPSSNKFALVRECVEGKVSRLGDWCGMHNPTTGAPHHNFMSTGHWMNSFNAFFNINNETLNFTVAFDYAPEPFGKKSNSRPLDLSVSKSCRSRSSFGSLWVSREEDPMLIACRYYWCRTKLFQN
jgi:hypothetical protein